jgi:ankyrin repeat protein
VQNRVMRLLHTLELEKGGFKIEEFGDNSIPQYAILSHTWDKEEVTLQDMEGKSAMETKKGYAKVKSSCSQARKDGFEYIWIDTCCIDKASSAELSEALNSMYRWYEEAELCYAFLADVPQGTGAGDEFKNSKWFTRGWTLQELIAPSTVIFFDSEWQRVGDKSDLQKPISKITGIPGNFLLGDDLGYASIAQRMSWAAQRKTTRIEDLAYCLMGIFGIYMPMLYGEGERAFIRLQEEIMRITDDHSLFAWRWTEDHGGILATSPAAFAKSGNIIPTNSSNVISSPLTLSSRGIRLSLRFKTNENQGSGLAILDCTEGTENNKRLAIHLRDVFLTKQDFTREQSSKLELIDLGDINLSQYPLVDLYVRHWRSKRNRSRGDIEKCAIKLKGVGEEVAAHTVFLHPNWELRNGLMVTTMILPANGILGRLLVVCKDGNSFQLVLKKCGRFLSTEVHNGFEVDIQLSQGANISDQQQHEQDRVVSVLADGRHIHVTIEKRILMFRNEKHRIGLVEMQYPATNLEAWLQHISVLEGDIKGRTLLSYAAENGDEALVKLLLEKGAALASKDEDGWMPLSRAARNGHEAVVKLLLEKSTNLVEKDTDLAEKDKDYGKSMLPWAARKWHKATVKPQESKGTDLELKDDSGRTPLSWAAEEGHEAVVKLLLEKGADVETKDTKYGRTPLSQAAKNGREAVVKLLLTETGKANVDWKDKNGWTPLSWAAEGGHKAVVELLLKAGAKVDYKYGVLVSKPNPSLVHSSIESMANPGVSGWYSV